jgi:hypothetical protein
VATRSRNGIGSLLGILVLAAVAFVLLNMFNVVSVGFGRFGCGWELNIRFGAMAEAASDDHCPTSISGAMNDGDWAADRNATIKDKYITTGLMYDEDGIEHEFTSGNEKGVDAQRVVAVLQEQGVPPNRAGRYLAASHVETKVAALMREAGVQQGVLVINNRSGPCGPSNEGTSCADVLSSILPAGSTLRVWFADASGTMQYRDFP